MPEVNLLPDEFRTKENKELESYRKQSKGFSIKLSQPTKENQKEKPVKKPGFFAKLFSSKKNKQTKIVEPKSSFIPGKKFEIKIDQPTGPKISEPKPVVISKPAIIKETKSTFTNGAKTDLKLPKPEVKKEEIKVESIKPTIEVKPKIKKAKFNWKKFFSRKKNEPIIDKINHGSNKKIRSTKPGREEKMNFLDINLIPLELSRHPEFKFSQKMFIFIGSIFLTFLLVFSAYLGLIWYQIIVTRQIQSIKEEIFVLDDNILKYQKEEISIKDLQGKFKYIEGILNNHIYWTKFFSMLEKNTVQEVYYTNFSMSGQEKVVISAVGKDYNSVAKQLLAFKNATDFIQNVRIDSAAAIVDKDGNYAGVNFNIYLDFQPLVFNNPVK